MKKIYRTLLVVLLSAGVFSVKAQDTKKEMDDKYVENDVVSLAGKKGFSFSTKAGDFLFKPYALVQASACYNRYDDQGLESHYAKSVANSGFAIPNAILGFTGKAFGRVTFNLSLNAAKSGGALLQQAWFDVAIKESFRIRVGKFKTPFMHCYLSTLGETLFPVLPYSASQSVLLPYDVNYVIPNMSTGFDLGVQVHGLIHDKWNYQVGIFNGTGIDVNLATKTNIKSIHGNGCAPLQITGKPLSGICYDSPVASAQVKSAILLAGLYAEGGDANVSRLTGESERR